MAIHLGDSFRLFRKLLEEAVHLDDCWASLALLRYLPHETIWIDCFFFALSPHLNRQQLQLEKQN